MMTEKEAFDAIIMAFEQQHIYIHKNYNIKYKGCQFIIKFCKFVPPFFDILLFIKAIGYENFLKFKITKRHGLLIKLDIKEDKNG